MFGSGQGFDNGAQQSERLARMFGGKKPKRTVFDSSMCAHVWAQGSQDWGRNAKGSMYFEGPIIYSYGSHYPMAQLTEHGVLINDHKYSVATGQHLACVRSAVRGRPMWEVSNPAANTADAHRRNAQVMYQRALSWLSSARNTRKKGRLGSLSLYREELDDANKYLATFVGKKEPKFKLVRGLAALEKEIRIDDARAQLREVERTLKRKAFDGRASKWGNDNRIDMRGYAMAKARLKRVQYTNVLKRLGADFEPIDAARELFMHRKLRAFANRVSVNARNPHFHGYRENAIVTAQLKHTWGEDYSEAQFEPERFVGHRGGAGGFKTFDAFARRFKTNDELAVLRAAQDERIAAQRAEWERQNAEREAKQAAERAERAKIHAERAERWRRDEYHGNMSDLPCMLRFDASRDEIETSWGAEFPAEHARKAWPMIKRIFDAGTAWQRNGATIRLGHFQIDRIAADGTVTAGCHTIDKAEIAALAAILFP